MFLLCTNACVACNEGCTLYVSSQLEVMLSFVHEMTRGYCVINKYCIKEREISLFCLVRGGEVSFGALGKLRILHVLAR